MFEKSITTSYLRSSKLVFSAFAALLLCGILITISQFEGAETLLKGKNYAQRKLLISFFFYYTRCISPKRGMSWRGPSPRHCARATQLLSKKRQYCV